MGLLIFYHIKIGSIALAELLLASTEMAESSAVVEDWGAKPFLNIV
jgi:hypothetical protein